MTPNMIVSAVRMIFAVLNWMSNMLIVAKYARYNIVYQKYLIVKLYKPFLVLAANFLRIRALLLIDIASPVVIKYNIPEIMKIMHRIIATLKPSSNLTCSYIHIALAIAAAMMAILSVSLFCMILDLIVSFCVMMIPDFPNEEVT